MLCLQQKSIKGQLLEATSQFQSLTFYIVFYISSGGAFFPTISSFPAVYLFFFLAEQLGQQSMSNTLNQGSLMLYRLFQAFFILKCSTYEHTHGLQHDC